MAEEFDGEAGLRLPYDHLGVAGGKARRERDARFRRLTGEAEPDPARPAALVPGDHLGSARVYARHAAKHVSEAGGCIFRGDYELAELHVAEAMVDLRWVRKALRELVKAERER